jgi:ABC-type transporter Mla subunit MlaD
MDGTYFKVGLFVIIASVVLIVGAGWLGAGAMQKDEYLIETYLNEAVGGLDVGAVVKFRGVPVGSLKEITFVSRKYETEEAYILLVLALDATKVHKDQNQTIEQALAEAVERGVRARLASGGLTGAAYIEVDVHEDDRQDWDPPLEVTWEPEHLYLPSVPSTITRMTQGVEKVLAQFTEADLPGAVKDIRDLVTSVTAGLKPTLANLDDS